MKVKTIPAPTLTAIQALLSPHVPDLTPTSLVAALRDYEPDGPVAAKEPMERMLTLRETADVLGVSWYTVRKMACDGRLAGATKITGQWRVPAQSVATIALDRPVRREP